MKFELKKETKFIQRLLSWLGKSNVKFTAVSILIVTLQTLYIFLRYQFINEEIPFNYTNLWGDSQLSPKIYIYAIPASGLILALIGNHLSNVAKKYYWQYLDFMFVVIPLLANVVMAASTISIILKASSPFEPMIDPNVMGLTPPFLMALVLTLIFTPKFIEIYKEKGIVTNPYTHEHPSMILKKPSTRGGGLIFTIFLIIVTTSFVGFTPETRAIYVGAGLLALIGIIDDFQNTNPRSKLKFFENPLVRLGSLFLVVLIPTYMGITIESINNPLNGLFDFSRFVFDFNGMQVYWLSILFTVVWIVWVLNVLSWSNGVDGQYGGIVGIAFIVIAILSLRFVPLETKYIEAAKIAAAAAGASFGLTYYNWYPSRIMWGFGAMSAGLVLSATSIIIDAKIATSILIILIPFLDATVIVIRRLLQKKNPFKGDRGHLHHLLMERGWGVRRISIFYWTTTALMGMLVIVTAGKDVALVTLTVSGLIAFGILFLHITATTRYKMLGRKEKQVKAESEKETIEENLSEETEKN